MNNKQKGDWIALDICPICKKERGIAIDQTMKGKFKDKHVITSFYLCDDCVKRLTELDRIILYEAEKIDPKKGPKITGRYLEVNAEPFRHGMSEEQLDFLNKNRIGFCDEEFFDKLITVRNDHVREN